MVQHHQQQGRSGGGMTSRTTTTSNASGGAASSTTPDDMTRPPSTTMNGGTAAAAGAGAGDDVSASFTNESRELFQHLESLQKQMYEEQEHGEDEEDEDDDDDNDNDENSSTKKKPFLNVLTSISLLSLQASKLLFWKPASTLLLPELVDALKEYYRALAPQTIRIYVKLIPTFIHSMIEILSSTSKGNDFLMQVETTIQSLLKTATTQSSQEVVQTSVKSFVHLINALTTPQAKRATTSIVEGINSCQRALSSEEAQSLIRDISELYIRVIDTLGDTTTTSCIAEWSATFCVALEETRQDLFSSAEIPQPPSSASQAFVPTAGNNRNCNGVGMSSAPGEGIRSRNAPTAVQRSQQPHTTTGSVTTPLLSTPVRMTTTTTTLARTALGMPTPGSVLTVDEDDQEEDSFVKLFQQKFMEQRKQLLKQKRQRKRKTTGGGDAMSTTNTVPEVDEDEESNDDDDDDDDDAALWEPIPDPTNATTVARSSPIQQSLPTPTSIITTRASNKRKKKKKRIPKYTILFGCMLFILGLISIIWFGLGLYGMYHIYKGFTITTTAPRLTQDDPQFKVIYLTNKPLDETNLDESLLQQLGTNAIEQLTQQLIPKSEIDHLLLSTSTRTPPPPTTYYEESSILPLSSTLLSQPEEHNEEL